MLLCGERERDKVMAVNYGILPKVCEQKKHTYLRDGMKLRGICDVIKETFYDHYTFIRAKYGPLHTDTELDRRSVAKGRRQGASKGTRVDKQLSRVCTLMQKLKLGIAQFLNLRVLPERKRNATEKSAVHLSKTMLSNTRAFLTQWHYRGFEMIGTQVPVGCTVKRLGTGIDVVLRNPKTGVWLIVNTKVTAWKHVDRHTSHMMEKPYDKLEDSVRNQQQLQLLCERILFCKTYPDLGKDPSKLISEIQLCDASGIVRELPLTEWAIKEQERFWVML